MKNRPFSLIEENVIQHMNCMDLIGLIPDDYIDAIITDFPYGINFQSNQRVKTPKFEKIDNDKKPYIEWIEPAFAKLKDKGRFICFYRWDVQDVLIDEIERCGFTIKSQLVWSKEVHGMGDLTGEFSPSHELMIYATKGRYEFKGKRPTTVYKCKRVDAGKMIHPNEKPVELNQALIRDITEVGELCADFFSGSGSFSVAAKIEGRDFIACDTGMSYVNQGNLRVKQAQRRMI
jgi:adenine-specific DNA-methyltransferase